MDRLKRYKQKQRFKPDIEFLKRNDEHKHPK